LPPRRSFCSIRRSPQLRWTRELPADFFGRVRADGAQSRLHSDDRDQAVGLACPNDPRALVTSALPQHAHTIFLGPRHARKHHSQSVEGARAARSTALRANVGVARESAAPLCTPPIAGALGDPGYCVTVTVNCRAAVSLPGRQRYHGRRWAYHDESGADDPLYCVDPVSCSRRARVCGSATRRARVIGCADTR